MSVDNPYDYQPITCSKFIIVLHVHRDIYHVIEYLHGECLALTSFQFILQQSLKNLIYISFQN